jgi:hypothetical protein
MLQSTTATTTIAATVGSAALGAKDARHFLVRRLSIVVAVSVDDYGACTRRTMAPCVRSL